MSKVREYIDSVEGHAHQSAVTIITDLERRLAEAQKAKKIATRQCMRRVADMEKLEQQLAKEQSDLRKLKGWLWRHKGMESTEWIVAALGADAAIDRERGEG